MEEKERKEMEKGEGNGNEIQLGEEKSRKDV